MTSLAGLLTISVGNDGDFPRLRCELAPAQIGPAATATAHVIATRRIGVNPRLFQIWESHQTGTSTDPIQETDLDLLTAGLLQNVGTPSAPADARHLHGLVGEILWIEVMEAIDAGLGKPIRVDGHDWSATDHGGDGLTVYATPSGFCFRLWESKYHGTTAPVRDSANLACRQLRARSLSYLSRFSLVAQDLAGDEEIAMFYGRLPELWVNRDPDAGVGVTVTASGDADTDGDFDNVTTYFNLQPSQHQSALHLIGDVLAFADSVRNDLWKGCGLWTEP